MVFMILQEILKKLIKEKGIKITALAKQCNIPLQTLHNYLGGQNPQNLDHVKKVADFFGVSLDYLCFGVKPKDVATEILTDKEEIYAGIYEVVLRKIKNKKSE